MLSINNVAADAHHISTEEAWRYSPEEARMMQAAGYEIIPADISRTKQVHAPESFSEQQRLDMETRGAAYAILAATPYLSPGALRQVRDALQSVSRIASIAHKSPAGDIPEIGY